MTPQRDTSAPFPSFSGKAIDGSRISFPRDLRGQVSLVVCSARQVAQPMAQAYKEIYAHALLDSPAHALYEVIFVEGVTHRIMRPLLEMGLAKQAATQEARGRTLCYATSDAPAIQAQLGVHTALSAFAYLTDQQGLVRWKAHGMPTDEELTTMVRLAMELESSGQQQQQK